MTLLGGNGGRNPEPLEGCDLEQVAGRLTLLGGDGGRGPQSFGDGDRVRAAGRVTLLGGKGRRGPVSVIANNAVLSFSSGVLSSFSAAPLWDV